MTLQPTALARRPESEWQPVDIPRSQPLRFYKVVAAKGSQLLEVSDGSTAFMLNKWTFARQGVAWPLVTSCMLGHSSMEQALATRFPRHAVLSAAPKVLIAVEAAGHAYRHTATGAWALSQVSPRNLLASHSFWSACCS